MPEKKKTPADLALESGEQVGRAAGQLVGTTIKLARDVWQAAKIEAIKKGITLTQIIELSLRRYLEDLKKERNQKIKSQSS